MPFGAIAGIGSLLGGIGGLAGVAGGLAGAGNAGVNAYQPMNQGNVDQGWNNIAGNLYNQWSNNQSPGQMYWGPTQQYVNQTLSNPYQNMALNGASQGVADWRALGPENIPGAVNTMYNVGNIAAGPMDYVSSMLSNPVYSQVLSQLQNSPYLGQALSGAQTGAGIGNAFANYGNSQLGTIQNVAGQQNQMGNAVAGLAPSLQNWANTTSGIAGNLISWANGAAGPFDYLLGLGQQAASPMAGMQQLASSLPGWSQGVANAAANPVGQMQGLATGLPSWGAYQSANTETPVGELQGLTASLPGQATQFAQQALMPTGALQGQMNTLAGQQNVLAGLGQQAAGTFAPLTGAANSILNAGFDPQNALFNRTQQQLLDQSNAINAMSGVASSPYGAGLTAQNLSNFDINWQNNLLNRMTQAGSAAQGLYGQGLAGLNTSGTMAQGIGALGGQIGGLGSTISGLNTNASSIYNQGLGTAGNLAGAAGNLMAQGTSAYTNALNAMDTLNQGAGNLLGQQASISNQGLNTAANLNATAAGLGSTGGNIIGAGESALGTGLNLMQGSGSMYGQAGNLQQSAGNLYNQAAGLYGQIPSTILSGMNLGNQASALAASSAQLPQNVYAQNLLQMLAPANQGINAANTGAAALGNLGTAAGSAYGNAGSLINALVQGAQQNNLYPYNLYNTMMGNNLNALSQGINLGNAQYNLPETLMNAAQAYMGLGQTAAVDQEQIANQNFLNNAILTSGGMNALTQAFGGGYGGLGGGLSGSGLSGSGLSGLFPSLTASLAGFPSGNQDFSGASYVPTNYSG